MKMSSKTKALIVVGIILLVGIGVYILSSDNNSASNTSNYESNDNILSTLPENNDSELTQAIFTVDEVSQHNKEDDCWTIISGSVYDITSYVPRHPGGDEILKACGEDGTTLFTSRTDKDGERTGSGTPHSSSASNQLQNYLIGTLE